MGSHQNEIEQFIYEICYQPLWKTVSEYINQHPYSLDLKYSKIKYPDSAILEDMLLERTSNIRIKANSLFLMQLSAALWN